MSEESRQLLSELNKLVGQLESVVHAGAAATRGQVSETADQLRDTLKQAHSRVDDLRQDVQSELDRGVQATEQLVRGQPWLAIGIAAAAAFVLGLIVARRD